MESTKCYANARNNHVSLFSRVIIFICCFSGTSANNRIFHLVKKQKTACRSTLSSLCTFFSWKEEEKVSCHFGLAQKQFWHNLFVVVLLLLLQWQNGNQLSGKISVTIFFSSNNKSVSTFTSRTSLWRFSFKRDWDYSRMFSYFLPQNSERKKQKVTLIIAERRHSAGAREWKIRTHSISC